TECNGLQPWFEELRDHTILANYQALLNKALPAEDSSLIRLALLAGTTLSEGQIVDLLERLKVPKRYLQLTKHVRLWLNTMVSESTAETDKVSAAALSVMKGCGLLQHPERFEPIQAVLSLCAVEHSSLA